MKLAWKLLNVACIVLVLCAAWLSVRVGLDAWITPNQRAARLMNQGKPSEAAEFFHDPFLKGVAQYRAGDFKIAAQTFLGVPGADALFNQANARIMLGEYDRAVELYDQVLELSPGRDDAITNREVAIGRAERVRDEGGQMTGGMLGADEIVFDSKPSQGAADGTEAVEGETLSDEALRGLWLREVQTTPADFLQAKFGFQLYRSNNPDAAGANNDGASE